MKVSELREKINQFSNGDEALLELGEALKGFDSMPIGDFLSFLNSNRIQAKGTKKRSQNAGGSAIAMDEAVSRLSSLKIDADAFESELDKIGKPRAFTKKKLQHLYVSIFDTKSYLPDTLSKSEMIARIKRQRRRDANFASA